MVIHVEFNRGPIKRMSIQNIFNDLIFEVSWVSSLCVLMKNIFNAMDTRSGKKPFKGSP